MRDAETEARIAEVREKIKDETRQALVAECIANGGEPIPSDGYVVCLRKICSEGASAVLWRSKRISP